MGAFLIIFIVAKVTIQLIVSAFDYLQQVPILGFVGSIISAAVGVVEMLIIVVVFLFMIALIPIEFIQNLVNGGLSQQLIDNTFILSGRLKSWID